MLKNISEIRVHNFQMVCELIANCSSLYGGVRVILRDKFWIFLLSSSPLNRDLCSFGPSQYPPNGTLLCGVYIHPSDQLQLQD